MRGAAEFRHQEKSEPSAPEASIPAAGDSSTLGSSSAAPSKTWSHSPFSGTAGSGVGTSPALGSQGRTARENRWVGPGCLIANAAFRRTIDGNRIFTSATKVHMYCAKCGRELSVATDGRFVCPYGLEYSAALSQQFRERYSSAAIYRANPSGAGTLFCPGCGDALAQREQDCGTCGVRLTRSMIFHLVELHPHPDGRGGHF